MQQMIDGLKEIMSFKDTTETGDIILVVGKEPQLLYYGYVTDIERDSSRVDEWWHLHIQMLTIPPQKVVWTLRTPQMTGMEIFTMGGEERFVKAVKFEEERLPPPRPVPPPEKKTGKGKIVPLKLVK